MTNPIGRRLDRLETQVEKKTNPGYGPVFRFIDDPEGVERCRRENPDAFIIHRVIVRPPDRSSEPGYYKVESETVQYQ